MDIIKRSGARAASAVLAGLALVGLAAPLQAAEEATAVKVRHVAAPADLAQGDRLLGRLGEAALEACGAFRGSLKEYRDAVRGSACWRASMTDVVARIGDPTLTNAFRREGKVEVASAGEPVATAN